MSAVLNAHSEENRPSPTTKPAFRPIDIREGDWKAYLVHLQQAPALDALGMESLLDAWENLTAYKRACALAYLGRRAQIHGGVCSATHPHVLTPAFLANLESANKAQRYARYPWLESLVAILAEIERIQDQIATNSNVIAMASGLR